MKFQRVALIVAVGWIVAGVAFLVYRSTLDKRRLKHALNLDSLPPSLEIVASANDIWTDYIVLFSCEIAPKDLEGLLSGRDFEDVGESRWGYRPETISTKNTDWANNLPDLAAVRKFQWREDEDDGAACDLYVGKHTRSVRIEYSAD